MSSTMINQMLSDKISYYNDPFDHWVIDDFFDIDEANKLSDEFIDFNDEKDVVHYKGWIGDKKTCNVWNRFPPSTYNAFFKLLSLDFTSEISDLTGIAPLYPDVGLHGGGWHMHRSGGSLAVHLDYATHPKLNLLRKLNLIIYLEKDYNPEWGGSLEFWSHDFKTNKPSKKITQIQPVFNRAVLFDTSQNSWHGFAKPIQCPEGKMRKSFAIYYLTDLEPLSAKRYKALYVDTND